MTNNLTIEEHWDLNQGLWRMLGCDMELKKKHRNTIVSTTKDVHLKLFDFLMSRKKDYVLIRNNNKENKK